MWLRKINEAVFLVSFKKADLKEFLSLWIKLANKWWHSPIPKHYWLHIKCHRYQVHESREGQNSFKSSEGLYCCYYYNNSGCETNKKRHKLQTFSKGK